MRGRHLRIAATALAGLLATAAPGPAQQQGGNGGETSGAVERQEAPVRLSAEGAVRRAVRENEQVLMARAEETRTRGLVRQTRARSLPDVTTTFDYNRNIQSPVIFFNTAEGVQQIRIGNTNEFSFGLNLQQTLFDPSLGPARAAARLSREATAAQVEAARNDVARTARVSYYRVLLNRELVAVQEAALEQARDRLEQVREFHRAGTGSEFDTLTARVEMENIRPRLIQARNDMETSRDELKRVIGVPLDRPLTLTDSLRGPGEEIAREEAVERAMSGRADLRSQRTRVSLQNENVTAEKNSGLPTLSLNASLNRRASSEDLAPGAEDFSQSVAAGVSFSLPLFDGRAREGRVLQARAELQREEYRLESLRKQVRLEVERAVKSLESARQQIEASRSNVRRAERALEIAQTRFENGLSTQVELNDAELAVTRARTNFAEALYSYNVARANLMAAMGER